MAETFLGIGAFAAATGVTYNIAALTTWQKVKTFFWRYFTRSRCQCLLLSNLGPAGMYRLLKFIDEKTQNQDLSDWTTMVIDEGKEILNIPTVQFSLSLNTSRGEAIHFDVIPLLSYTQEVTGFEFWSSPTIFWWQNGLRCFREMRQLLHEVIKGTGDSPPPPTFTIAEEEKTGEQDPLVRRKDLTRRALIQNQTNYL